MFQRKTAPALFPASATAGGRAGKTIYPTPHGIPPLYTKSNKSKPISVARVLLAAMLLVIVYWGFQRQYTTTLTESGATTTNENLYYADIDTSTIKVAIPGQDYDPEWGLRSMRRKFNCEEHFSHPRPLYTSEQWDYMRRVYQAAVLGLDPQQLQQQPPPEPSFRVPYQVRQDPEKGRGIFATRKITKGTVIWTAARTASFEDGASYRKFLFSVGDDGLACDIMQWAYIFETKADGKHHIYLDLGDGSFVNNCGGNVEPNNGCLPEVAKSMDKGGCDYYEYALRDIEAGEEITLRYRDFEVPGGREAYQEFGIPLH